MNIQKLIQDDRQAKLTVEYTSDEFEGFKRRAAKKISKNVKIPGFRPGKAPFQVIVNHYGEEVIVQEALDLLIETDYPKILEQAEIEPSGSGNLETLEKIDPPKFILMVPLKPEINLGNYREIRKDYALKDFDPAEVDNYIMNLRRNSATIVPADRAAEVGDLVYFNLSGEFLNPDEDEEATITDKTPQQVVIPTEEEISKNEWPFPGFSRQLLGVKGNDSKEIQHTYPADYEDEEFRGKTAIFSVDVQSVKALELPEFDEDFVQSLGTFDTPEEFREKLEAQLIKEHELNYEQNYINELLNEIIEKAELNYPPQMVDHEVEHILNGLKNQLKKQNMEYETYLKLRDKDEETFTEEEILPVATQRLERSLVIDALIENEGLKLNKDLLIKQVENVVNEVLRSGKVEDLQKDMGNDEFSRMISMEGLSRTMEVLLKERLKLIGTGQPIPEEDQETEIQSEDVEDTKASEEIEDLEMQGTETETGNDELDDKEASAVELETKNISIEDENTLTQDTDESEGQ